MVYSQFRNDPKVNGSFSRYVYEGLKDIYKLENFKSRAMVQSSGKW